MRLLKLRLHQFRRFAEDQGLDLNEDLIALVGPNEAGKSSILDAIEYLSEGKGPTQSDVTRGLPGPARVSGLYFLEADDRESLSHIHNGDRVHRVWIHRQSNRKKSTWGLDERPGRDLAPRRRCHDLLRALQDDLALDVAHSRDPKVPWDPQLYVGVVNELDSSAETLSDEAVNSLETLASRLRDLECPESESHSSDGEPESSGDSLHSDHKLHDRREQAAAALTELVLIERQPTPAQQVIDALEDRVPVVAFFQRENRDLQSDYAFSEIANDPPPALANLCSVAELDLGEVATELTAGRQPHVEKLFEDANVKLRERFQGTWTQSDVYPRLGPPHEGVLRIWIATEGETDYSEPQERSDGLRWFISLHAFLVAKGAAQPVLLVDELETHLHYDAQADLIDALMRQQIATKVVYTTHSVGCLPPDLGSGIRAILAEQKAERSHIANSYWSVDPGGDERVGYTPLLFAMGARLLALTVPRYAVIGEGPSDAILLPRLLREAAGVSALPYRVVPGLSDLKGNRLDSLTEHAGKVACLADGDAEGLRKIEQIKEVGLDPASLFTLADIKLDCTLEDLVKAEVFAEAVNLEIDTWGIRMPRVQAKAVPDVGRWGTLVDANQEDELRRLSKTRVAQRIVDLGRPGETGEQPQLLPPPDHRALRILDQRIRKFLGV